MRLAALLATVTAALALAVPAAADQAEVLYDPEGMSAIELTLDPAAFTSLRNAPEKYVSGSFSYAPTDGTPGGIGTFSAPLGVEVRLKGSGSFRTIDGKAAFKLKFAKAAPFIGLRKMTLNNMVEDRSMIHEALAYRAFGAAGVPASRSGYAYLTVNGVDFGVYANVETLDNVSLARIFGSFDKATQHLYEGEEGADVVPGGAGDFEIDEGDEGNVGDLEALIAAASGGPAAGWSARVAPHADLDEMTRMWAGEKYIGQWDGYSGREGEFWPNNYYLLSDPAGRFRMLSSGLDESWREPVAFDGRGGLLFNRCLEDPACAELYRASLRAVADAVGGLGLDAIAARTAAMLRPWQQREIAQSSREEASLSQIDAAVGATRAFIAARPAEAEAWLGPRPPADPVTQPAAVGRTPDQATPLRAFKRPHLVKRTLRTPLATPGPGLLFQRVMLTTAKGRTSVCVRRLEVARARTLTLGCQLSDSARKRRQRAPLQLEIVTRFQGTTGTSTRLTHHLTLPRT